MTLQEAIEIRKSLPQTFPFSNEVWDVLIGPVTISLRDELLKEYILNRDNVINSGIVIQDSDYTIYGVLYRNDAILHIELTASRIEEIQNTGTFSE